MRDTVKALIVTAALLLAIVVTGCVQNNGIPADSGAGTGVMPPETSPASPGQPGTGHIQNGQTTDSGPGIQNPRQHGQPNATVLAQAAAKLGISRQELENALTGQAGTRQNLSVAAEQLNVSPQQLAEALGFAPENISERFGHNGTTRLAGS